MSLQIFYGVENNYQDVTQHALHRLSKTHEFINNKQLIIPKTDTARAAIFGDPIVGIVKHILVVKNDQKKVYHHSDDCVIDVSDINGIDYSSNKQIKDHLLSVTDPAHKLQFIHDNIFFNHGNIMHEYPEQLMACRFIKPDNHVLEIGANIGRNTLVIATILDDDKNLVTLECDQHTVNLLTNNKEINNYAFGIEDSALSKRKLVQRGWDTIPSDEDLPGYSRIKTITFPEIETKYNITFDTLVADCEGALYYILMDDPDMLNNIKMVVMENDYHDITHKQKVDEILTSKGFQIIYQEGGGWGPCWDRFYEAWAKE